MIWLCYPNTVGSYGPDTPVRRDAIFHDLRKPKRATGDAVVQTALSSPFNYRDRISKRNCFVIRRHRGTIANLSVSCQSGRLWL
jgi:hypothetical protein